MKSFLALFILSLCSVSYACPDISGTYSDEDGELVTIAQTGCEKLNWMDADVSTAETLIADNVERIVEQEGKNVAYGKARFTQNDFVLELRVVYSSDVPADWPVHYVTSYRIDKHNNLLEKIESTQGTEYVTFKRVK